MKNILNKKEFKKLNETFNIVKGSDIYIHHPITQDIIKVKVVRKYPTTVEVAVLNDSPYFGQPNFKINKLNVIGVAN